jgi:hypothetical protein
LQDHAPRLTISANRLLQKNAKAAKMKLTPAKPAATARQSATTSNQPSDSARDRIASSTHRWAAIPTNTSRS